jgi:hypothetical protein
MAEATKYTILAPADGGAWKEVGTSTAQTREQALELLLDDQSDGGEFMVVPSRYWGEPLLATVEHTRRVTVAAKAKARPARQPRAKGEEKAEEKEAEPEAAAQAT